MASDILSNLDQLERIISSSNNQADATITYLHGGGPLMEGASSKAPEGILPRLQAAVESANNLYTKLITINQTIEASDDGAVKKALG